MTIKITNDKEIMYGFFSFNFEKIELKSYEEKMVVLLFKKISEVQICISALSHFLISFIDQFDEHLH